MKQIGVNRFLDTPVEKSMGKEIKVINIKEFSHQELLTESKSNRLKAEFFYIYDYEKFNNCSLLKSNFDIFEIPNAINHTSARYVIHYLTKELKKRFKEIDRTSKYSETSLYDIFKPSLGQFDDKDIIQANACIRKMFPYEGCTYTGEKLEQIINKFTWITLLLSLRIIWSLLPGAIIPWKSFREFQKKEKMDDYKNLESFYQNLPIFLPSHNHCCLLFEFLEIFIAIFADDYFIDLNIATDLIFTAGQICFNRDEFKEPESQTDDDLHELQKFYYNRGAAFYQIFVAYLRSLSREPSFEFKALLDVFKIEEYPPKPYKPLAQKALTLTVPSDPELVTTNYFKLISNASNATSRIYSSNHTFTKFENKFLDKFEINPHKIVEHFFSKSSKNYLLKFDSNLKFDNFRVNNEIAGLRKNLKNGTGLFENKDFVSTFINEFNRYGFESQRDNHNNSETFITDTINFNFNSNMEKNDSLPVRVSKLEISEWFINAWKYETFLGYLQNTVILKLTKTIGDCDWLIITSHDKVSSHNRYLTPPSSTGMPYDTKKSAELGGSLEDEELEEKEPSDTKEPLLPAAVTSKKVTSPRAPKLSNRASSKSNTSKTKESVRRVSLPSLPKDTSDFEKLLHAKNSKKTSSPDLTLNKKVTEKKKPTVSPPRPPPPVPVITNQRMRTPNRQKTDSWVPPPVLRSTNKYTPPRDIKSKKSVAQDLSSAEKLEQLQISDEQQPKELSNGLIPPKSITASSTGTPPKDVLPDLESPFVSLSKDLSEVTEAAAPVAPPKAKAAHPYSYRLSQRPSKENVSNDSTPAQPKALLKSLEVPSSDSSKNEPSVILHNGNPPVELPSTSYTTANGRDSKSPSKLNLSNSGASKIIESSVSTSLSAMPKNSFAKRPFNKALNNFPNSESSGSSAHINNGSIPNERSNRLSLLENDPELIVVPDLPVPDLSAPEVPYTPQPLKSRTSNQSMKNSKDYPNHNSEANLLSHRDDSKDSELLENASYEGHSGFVHNHKDDRDFESHDGSTNNNDVFDSYSEESESTQEICKNSAPKKEPNMNLGGLLEEITEAQSFFNTEDFIISNAADGDAMVQV